MSDGPSVHSLSLFPAFFRLPCSAVAHSARLDNNNNTSNPSPASAPPLCTSTPRRRRLALVVDKSTFNKWQRGDVRGGSFFFLHSLLIDCVMRQQVFWVKISKVLVILVYFGWSGSFAQISNNIVNTGRFRVMTSYFHK